MKRQVTIPVFIPHLGCPCRCVACSQWSATGAPHTPTPLDVRKKIEEYLPRIKKSVTRVEAAFFGGSFTALSLNTQRDFLSAVKPYLDKGLIGGIRLSTRPDSITKEILALLRNFGVRTVELGAQSFSDDVLLASGRGHKASDTIKAAVLLKKYGFDSVIQLMPGLPLDTKEKSLASAKAAAELAPKAVRIYPTVVMKGTVLEKLYKEGRYKPLFLQEAVELVKEIYAIFKEKDIDVIRMGIHPLSPKERSSAIAGPYHEAFGFLVKAALRRDETEAEIARIIEPFLGGGKKLPDIVLNIPAAKSGEYIGSSRENISYLKKRFYPCKLKYEIVNTERLAVRIA